MAWQDTTNINDATNAISQWNTTQITQVADQTWQISANNPAPSTPQVQQVQQLQQTAQTSPDTWMAAFDMSKAISWWKTTWTATSIPATPPTPITTNVHENEYFNTLNTNLKSWKTLQESQKLAQDYVKNTYWIDESTVSQFNKNSYLKLQEERNKDLYSNIDNFRKITNYNSQTPENKAFLDQSFQQKWVKSNDQLLQYAFQNNWQLPSNVVWTTIWNDILAAYRTISWINQKNDPKLLLYSVNNWDIKEWTLAWNQLSAINPWLVSSYNLLKTQETKKDSINEQIKVASWQKTDLKPTTKTVIDQEFESVYDPVSKAYITKVKNVPKEIEQDPKLLDLYTKEMTENENLLKYKWELRDLTKQKQDLSIELNLLPRKVLEDSNSWVPQAAIDAEVMYRSRDLLEKQAYLDNAISNKQWLVNDVKEQLNQKFQLMAQDRTYALQEKQFMQEEKKLNFDVAKLNTDSLNQHIEKMAVIDQNMEKWKQEQKQKDEDQTRLDATQAEIKKHNAALESNATADLWIKQDTYNAQYWNFDTNPIADRIIYNWINIADLSKWRKPSQVEALYKSVEQKVAPLVQKADETMAKYIPNSFNYNVASTTKDILNSTSKSWDISSTEKTSLNSKYTLLNTIDQYKWISTIIENNIKEYWDKWEKLTESWLNNLIENTISSVKWIWEALWVPTNQIETWIRNSLWDILNQDSESYKVMKEKWLSTAMIVWIWRWMFWETWTMSDKDSIKYAPMTIDPGSPKSIQNATAMMLTRLTITNIWTTLSTMSSSSNTMSLFDQYKRTVENYNNQYWRFEAPSSVTTAEGINSNLSTPTTTTAKTPAQIAIEKAKALKK